MNKDKRNFIVIEDETYELIGATPFTKQKVDLKGEFQPFVTEKREDVSKKVPFLPTFKEIRILREFGIKAQMAGFGGTDPRVELYLTYLHS